MQLVASVQGRSVCKLKKLDCLLFFLYLRVNLLNSAWRSPVNFLAAVASRNTCLILLSIDSSQTGNIHRAGTRRQRFPLNSSIKKKNAFTRALVLFFSISTSLAGSAMIGLTRPHKILISLILFVLVKSCLNRINSAPLCRFYSKNCKKQVIEKPRRIPFDGDWTRWKWRDSIPHETLLAGVAYSTKVRFVSRVSIRCEANMLLLYFRRRRGGLCNG